MTDMASSAWHCRWAEVGLLVPTAIPCWWRLARPKQLSMAVTARVIWLCACVRYWPDHGLVFECVTCFYCCFIKRCRQLLTALEVETRTSDCKRDTKDKITWLPEVCSSWYCPKNTLIKVPKIYLFAHVMEKTVRKFGCSFTLKISKILRRLDRIFE